MPTSTPATAVCGNGAVESGEECDDANASADDACDWVRYLRFIAEATRTTDLETEQASILAYNAARDEFLRRFHEAGGTTCE